MKKIIGCSLFVCLTVLLFSFSSVNFDKSSLKQEVKQQTPFKLKIRLRFKWDGVGGPTNPCFDYGSCGKCPGICVVISFEPAANRILSASDKAQGDGYAFITVNKDRTLTLEPEENSMDEGKGFVTIKSDFVVSNEVSQLLGEKSMVIKAGDYKIDYSNGLKFGSVNLSLK